MIVFTSDHGDYLGDHWMGEKELFHEPSVKIPLIVYDLVQCRRCDARHAVRRTGGGDRPGADVPRSFRRRPGAAIPPPRRPLAAAAAVRADAGRLAHVRRSANTITRCSRWAKRSACRRATSGCSCSPTRAGSTSMPSGSGRCCSTWKRIRTSSPTSAPTRRTKSVRRRFAEALAQWGLRLSQRVTRSDQQVLNMRGGPERRGVLIGVWEESELPDEMWSRYRGDSGQ